MEWAVRSAFVHQQLGVHARRGICEQYDATTAGGIECVESLLFAAQWYITHAGGLECDGT